MEEKLFVVIVDGVPTFNLSVNKLQTIKSIKKFLNDKYENYNIKMYINPTTELKVFETHKYNNVNFESVWNDINNGRIEVNMVVNRNETKTQSVKVSELRKVYGKDVNLRKWLEDPQNVYVGRRGRIFIDGEVFHYPQSKWANPFKVMPDDKKGNLQGTLELYRNHLEKEGLLTKEHLQELKGKTLGCFCLTASTTPSHKIDCHTKVLLNEISKHC